MAKKPPSGYGKAGKTPFHSSLILPANTIVQALCIFETGNCMAGAFPVVF